MRTARLKEKIRRGQAVIGPVCNFMDPQAIEALGLVGFDFVILDHEHGRISVKEVENLVRAAECSGTSPVIRVAELSPSRITAALDAGAEAVQVPNLATVEHARTAVMSARYFEPGGQRGTSPYNRAADYDIGGCFDAEKLDQEQLLIIQVEGQEGLANLEAILQVPGIDGIFLGPNDIARSLGLAGQMDHPRVQAAVEDAVRKIKVQGLFAGTFCRDAAQARQWMGLGVQYVSVSMDIHLLAKAGGELLEQIRADPG